MPIEEEHISSIIDGCINQNRKAQEQLYRSYYKVMMNLCLRYTKNEADALAILNNAFYKVFKNIKMYDPAKATLYTWIRTITINTCIDHLKPTQNKIATSELVEAENVFIEPSVIAKMKEGALLMLVQQLAPSTRAVFNLYIMEGFGHKEIGQLLHISEGTSKWHLNDARKKLKILITQEQQQY